MLKQIFIANSVYALFLYCLRFCKQIDETLFLLGPSCTFAKVNHCLPMFSPPTANTLPLVKSIIQQQAYLLLEGNKVPCYGNVETVFSDFFVQNFDFYPLSDGLRDTVTFATYVKEKRFRKCYAVKYEGGLDMDSPLLEYLDINSLWQNLDMVEKQKIAQIFCVEDSFFDVLKQRKNILITQPLSEDNICSESDKIELYKRILSNYDEADIVIKPHPREVTDWMSVFPKIPVIPKHIPSEMIPLLISDLQKVITFFSTAAFTMLTPCKIDFYAKDFGLLKYYCPERRIENQKSYKSIASFDVEEKYHSQAFNWLKIPDEDGFFYRK